MQAGQSVEEWARTARFPRPVRWAEVEAEILARELPASREESVPLSMWARAGASWMGIGVIALVTFGSSVIGLGMVIIGSTASDGEVARQWLEYAHVPFVVAPVVQLFILQVWWETRRRVVMVLPLGGITVLASVAAFLMLRLVSEVGGMRWLPILTVTSAVMGCAVLVTALRSRPEGRNQSRRPPRRGPRSSRKRGRCMRAREMVVQILLERGLVDLDEADRKRLLEMPLGYWEELDDTDEAEWRRILELRSVGWRDFDATDGEWTPRDVNR